MMTMVLILERDQWRPVEQPLPLVWLALALALGALSAMLALVIGPAIMTLGPALVALGVTLGFMTMEVQRCDPLL